MAAIIVSSQIANGFEVASSDDEFQQSLREAIEASDEDYAFRIQLEETLHLSNLAFAHDCQQADTTLSSPVSNPSSSKDGASSSYSKDNKECMPVNYYEHDHDCGAENGVSSRGKEMDTELEQRQCSIQVKKPVPLELCGICFETADMFEGIHCLHRFCHPCMTKYIHTQLQQNSYPICCPHESCNESLTPEECGYFLPVEIIDAWSAIIVEAQIPESDRVYCPFPDCSAMLVKEDVVEISAMEILNAECPFCHRMFCVRCMVPWHSDLGCEERSEEDRQLFKLAEAKKWQRCGKCKRMIELEYGCNHMTCRYEFSTIKANPNPLQICFFSQLICTGLRFESECGGFCWCRCGYEFCYGCGTGWTNGRPTCNCH